MKTTLLLAGLLAASSGLADFSGNWVGTGQLAAQGGVLDCDDVVLELNQTAAEFEFVRTSFVCNGITRNYSFPVFRLEGGDLYLEDVVIGEVEADYFGFDYETDDTGVFWDVHLEGDSLRFLFIDMRRLDAPEEDFLYIAELHR